MVPSQSRKTRGMSLMLRFSKGMPELVVVMELVWAMMRSTESLFASSMAFHGMYWRTRRPKPPGL